MAVIIVAGSALLLLLGLLTVVLWGGRSIREPPAGGHGLASGSTVQDFRTDAKLSALRRYFWWANVVSFSALASALFAAWPGGRLIMRILADTSPDSAQGRLTEADFNVGFPSVGGTMALLLFAGLPAGFLAAILFPLIRRWLPRGRVAGPLFGLLLMVWLGSVLDPLRATNIDFTIVGPGWLAVALFAGLALLHGAVAAAAAGWWSERLPLWSNGAAKYYVPLLAGGVLFPPFAVLVVAGSLVILLWLSVIPASRLSPPRPRHAPAWLGVGALALVTAAALPVFISAVFSISTRAS
ncbi:hypothetical protein [Pseudarthrobacter sulfonivorans]|uniref:hypothetical protein n=1 Tax=Pseudarthrobacter sulfonivorans TaxID=121292 RepID=UPI00286261A7|nr:hypothetical protein [Pseudarthrobacter sulfonivorans]MDR6415166.1 hypothetical protein [Pseudarthrobacter sulfonivorans]